MLFEIESEIEKGERERVSERKGDRDETRMANGRAIQI